MWPLLMRLNVGSPNHHRVRLWLPLFLLWPLLVLLLALPLLITVIVDACLLLAGREYHHYTILVLRALALLGDTRGLVLRIDDGKTDIDLTVV